MRFWSCLAAAVLSLLAASGARAQINTTEVALLLSHTTARPGETVTAALRLRMAPKWHTYWQSPGESGIATKITWTLPAGVTAGEIQWPVPEKATFSGLTTYDYHGEIFLLIPLTLAPDTAPGSVEIKADVKWLECEAQGQCVPGKAKLTASLKIGTDSAPSPDAKAIQDARKLLPQPGAAAKAKAGWEKLATGDTRPLVIEWSVPGAPGEVDFFPIPGDDDKWEIAHATEKLSSEPGMARVRKLVKKNTDGGAWPTEIKGLLVHKNAGEKTGAAYEVTLKFPGETVATPAATKVSGEPESFAKMLWFAFLGGIILNIMPCVFPVIALKILGFVNQSKEDPRGVLRLGVIYSLGVIASFLVMAGMVLAVRAAGRDASWGMQMQNPQFTTALTVLMTLVAMNLFGVFEVTAAGAVNAAGSVTQKGGASGAFFNGVLAVVLATPCTAPFLAPALGFAFAQPPAVVVLFFALVGLGLALPYLVLSAKPAWVRLLPRPGAWMGKFKIAMGFPMLATAVWIFSFTAPRFGKSGPLWLGLLLVIVALAAWVFGEFIQRGGKRRGLAIAVCLGLLAFGYFKVLEDELHWRMPKKSNAVETVVESNAPDAIAWQKWSADAVAKARASGRVVLVDFTADWCLTCQANLRSSIDIAATRQKLKQLNAATFIADNTDPTPEIVAELKKFGRAGVPLVLIYPKDVTKPPLVLPALLTPAIVANALDEAAK